MMAALGPESELIMPCLPTAYKGPTIVMIIGTSFALLGAIPVAVTMGIGSKHSATIIGMGFVGFGILILLPGLCWCLAINYKRHIPWSRRNRQARATKEREVSENLRDNNLLPDEDKEDDDIDITGHADLEQIQIMPDSKR